MFAFSCVRGLVGEWVGVHLCVCVCVRLCVCVRVGVRVRVLLWMGVFVCAQAEKGDRRPDTQPTYVTHVGVSVVLEHHVLNGHGGGVNFGPADGCVRGEEVCACVCVSVNMLVCGCVGVIHAW